MNPDITMPILTGLFRLGRDAELRKTDDGDAIINLGLAYNYGRRDGEGKKPTQWIDAALWGKKAEALAPYLLKGSAWEISLEEVHIEEFHRRDGSAGWKMVGRVVLIDFASPKQQPADGAQQQRSAAPTPTPAARAPAASRPGPASRPATGFDDMDDDIPF